MSRDGSTTEVFPKGAFLSTVLDHTADAVIGIDGAELILSWNPGAVRIFGYTSEEAMGQPVSLLVPKGIVAPGEAGELRRRLLAEGAVHRFATTRRAKDGRLVRVEIDEVPLPADGAEGPAGTILLMRDLTSALQLSHVEGQDARLTLLGGVAAQLAHEVRNPLNSVILNASLLEEALADYRRTEQLDIAEAEEAIAILLKEVRNLREVTDEFMAFARLPAGKSERVQVNTLIRGLFRFLRRELVEARVKPALSLDRGLPKVRVNMLRLKQALLNIVRNALEAMPEGGRLAVETCERDGMVEISLADSGSGIEAEQLEFIFRPFFTTKERGTGLGLSYSRECVRAEGGDIRHEGRPGQGATFVISLPVAPAASRLPRGGNGS